MIRRHFLAGLVGIKALCAAAALAVGVGQAQAATYDVIFTLESAVFIDYPIGAEAPTYTNLDKWNDLPVLTPLVGTLDFSTNWLSLVVEGVSVIDINWPVFVRPDGVYSWLYPVGGASASLTWDGSWGKFEYREDGFVKYLNADATIELAPIPLPATAAILPLGIGALAMMRRRRKA